jgi:8-oxo-dGTP pyrophosphatase MutT (NUDIX family)
VLIRRGMNLRSNPGEIAFPGGRVEPGESPLGAALREAFEEVALDPSAVRLLGELPAVSRVSRPEPIAAFVVAVAGEPLLTPNPDEVDDILITPLAELVDPSVYWEELWRRPDGIVWRMSFFDLGDDLLWGASARILVSLFERLAAITTI